VHRDLKPSNVLLAEDGPRVIDFGICQMTNATRLTKAGFLVGSAGFMSPEQAEGDAVGPASDVFSLGAVLAFAATGKEPFGGGSSSSRIHRIVHSTPDLDGVPGPVRPLLEWCLAKDPADRPSAAEIIAWASAAVPEAAPGPATASGRRRTRSRRRMWRPLAVAGISATLLTASVTVGLALAGSGHQPPKRPPGPEVTRPVSAHSQQPQTDSFSLSGASQYSCSDEGVVRSIPSAAKVPFAFVNRGAAAVDVIWLNFTGRRVLYTVLAPGTSYHVDTYVGHDWLIAGSGAGCQGVFGISGPGEIVMTS
jgi:serine/threonine protein kinase